MNYPHPVRLPLDAPHVPVIAYHGDLATSEDLREDAGDPRFIDRYGGYDKSNNYENSTNYRILHELSLLSAVILIGYSRGGEFVAWLSRRLNNVRAAVLYEVPVFDILPGGEFPVMLIWNNETRRKPWFFQWAKQRRYQMHLRSIEEWSRNRKVTHETGAGGHFKKVDRPPLNLGHGWDTSLNSRIESWLKS